jgi:protein arginine phosphatase
VTTKHILFVCTGNTCRSPLAEGLCRMMAKREGMSLDVRSAGVSAMDGSPVSRHSGDILRTKGAAEGLAGSRFLRKEEINWAHLILTMTMSHKRSVIERHPEAVDKVFTLKEYGLDDPAVLRAIAERESFLSELELKHALGQPISKEERERLARMNLSIPDFDIADPFGGSRMDYEAAAKEIEAALKGLLRKLRTEGQER